MPFVNTGMFLTALTPEAATLNEMGIQEYNNAPWHGACSACPDQLFWAKTEDDLNEELLDHFTQKHRIIRDMSEVDK